MRREVELREGPDGGFQFRPVPVRKMVFRWAKWNLWHRWRERNCGIDGCRYVRGHHGDDHCADGFHDGTSDGISYSVDLGWADAPGSRCPTCGMETFSVVDDEEP